jgi:hypothetical protein
VDEEHAAAMHAPVLLVTGVVQRRGPTTNVLVQSITPWGNDQP